MATSVLRTLALRLRLNSAQFQKDIGKVDKRMKRLSGSMRRSANMFNSQLGQLGATFATGFGLAELTNAADTMVNLRNKMNATFETSQEVAQGMLDIKRIARESRADLDAVGTLYQRISVSTQNMGATQEEVAAVTQVVSNSFLMSGTTASEAANSARQFAQGLASGTLRGDEFRSVSENNVVLTKMLAEGLNLTVGELRLFAQEGGLTAEKILPILTGQLEFTNDAILDMRLNVSQARTLFKNSFTEMVDRVNSVFKVTDRAALVIKALSDNIHILTLAVSGFAVILMTKVLVGFAAWIAMTIATSVAVTVNLIASITAATMAVITFTVSSIIPLITAMTMLALAFIFNPFTIFMAKIAAVAAGIVYLENEFQLITRSVNFLISLFTKALPAAFDMAIAKGKSYFNKFMLFIAETKEGLNKFIQALGFDGFESQADNITKLQAKLKGLTADYTEAGTNFKNAIIDPLTEEITEPTALQQFFENTKKEFENLMPSFTSDGETSEGGMFGGMVEGFSAGVDGILNKIMESNPVLAKFWATLKGQNDPDVAAAEGGGQTAMADMSWSEKWIAAIGKIKEAFASMGASSKQTVKGMIERYDLFEEVLNKGIKNLKKNSHIRKGILMKEAIIEGKAAILKAWNSAPFPANLPGVAITTAATAMAIRDIMKGQAHDGMDSLPSTGTYMLEKGERVVSSRTNRDLTDFLASSSGGQSNMNTQPVTIQVNGISDPDMVVNALASRRGELEAMMRSIASENTRLSPF